MQTHKWSWRFTGKCVLRFVKVSNLGKKKGIGSLYCAAFMLGLSEIRKKMHRCRKNVHDGLKNAYYL